jgi:hypothetical protein
MAKNQWTNSLFGLPKSMKYIYKGLFWNNLNISNLYSKWSLKLFVDDHDGFSWIFIIVWKVFLMHKTCIRVEVYNSKLIKNWTHHSCFSILGSALGD